MMWLKKIAKFPHENNTWLGGPFTIIANEEPPKPLASNTKLSCLMLLARKSFVRFDGKETQLYQVSPLYSEERELEINQGVPALMRALDRSSVPFIVDVDRESVVRNEN